jgi:hypothetical protein
VNVNNIWRLIKKDNEEVREIEIRLLTRRKEQRLVEVKKLQEERMADSS